MTHPRVIDTPNAIVEAVEEALAEFSHDVSGECAQYVAYAAWVAARPDAGAAPPDDYDERMARCRQRLKDGHYAYGGAADIVWLMEEIQRFRQAALGQEPGADPRPLVTDAMIQRGLEAAQLMVMTGGHIAEPDRLERAAYGLYLSEHTGDHWSQSDEAMRQTYRERARNLRGLEATRGLPPEPAFVKLREWIQERQHGSCRMLSLGSACECPLCLLDHLHDAALRSGRGAASPPSRKLVMTEFGLMPDSIVIRPRLDAGPPPPDGEMRDLFDAAEKAVAVWREWAFARDEHELALHERMHRLMNAVTFARVLVRASPSEGEGQYWCERCGGVILPLSEAIWVDRKPYHVIHVPGHEPPPTPSPTFRPVGLMPDAVVVRASPSEGEPRHG